MRRFFKYLKKVFFIWSSAEALGIAISFYFSILLIGDDLFNQNLYFSAFSEWVRIILGVILFFFVVFSFIKPSIGGLAVTYILCASQIANAIILHEYIRIPLWIIIAVFATWGAVLKSEFIQIEEERQDVRSD